MDRKRYEQFLIFPTVFSKDLHCRHGLFGKGIILYRTCSLILIYAVCKTPVLPYAPLSHQSSVLPAIHRTQEKCRTPRFKQNDRKHHRRDPSESPEDAMGSHGTPCDASALSMLKTNAALRCSNRSV